MQKKYLRQPKKLVRANPSCGCNALPRQGATPARGAPLIFAFATSFKNSHASAISMIITISGVPGSGKSTVAGLVAKKLGFRHYSAGDFMREIAEKRGMSLLELGKAAEKDRSIDRELDERTVQLGKREDDFVMDSRLAYHFIPGSFKVFLEVDATEAAKRVFGDIKKNKEGRRVEKESKTLAATLAAIKKRRKSEELRYKKYYNLNPYDEKQYDLVIDTTKATPDKVVEKVVAAVKKFGRTC